MVRDNAFYTEEKWIWGTEIEFYIQGFSALAEFEPDSSGLARGARRGGLSCALKDA